MRCVLDFFGGSFERPEVLESLAKSSRAIVHTVYRLKMTSPDVLESRLTCLHLLCCSSCRSWDQKECPPPTKDVVPPSYNCNAIADCFHYLLPRLLFLPHFHFFHFYRLAYALHQQAHDPADHQLLTLVVDYLLSARLYVKSSLTRYPDLDVELVCCAATDHLVNVFPGQYFASGATGVSAHHRSVSASPATAASVTTPCINTTVATLPRSCRILCLLCHCQC